MFKYIKIAFRNVLANKRRSMFIGSAIAIGTIIMLLIVSLFNGIRDSMVSNSFAMFTGYVNVTGYETLRGETRINIPDYKALEERIKKVVPNAKLLYRTGTGGRLYSTDKQSVQFQGGMLMGINIDDEFLFKESVTVIDGIKDEDGNIDIEKSLNTIKEKNYALIEVTAAEKYDLKVGDKIMFEGKVETEELGFVNMQLDLTVGAIIQGITIGPMQTIIRVSNETVRDYTRMNENQTSIISIFFDNKYDSAKYADLIEAEFRKDDFKNELLKYYTDENKEKIEYNMEKFQKIFEKKYTGIDNAQLEKDVLELSENVFKEDAHKKFEEFFMQTNISKEKLKNFYNENITKEDFQPFKIKIRTTKRNKDRSVSSDDSGVSDDFDSSFQLKEKQDGLEIEVETWQEAISFLEEMIRSIELVAYILNMILMAIILIGISNTLVMAIKERTGEIGTLRAIGMQKPSVLLMFVFEGIILGILGSIIGIVIGGGIALYLTIEGIYLGPSPISIFLVNNYLHWNLTVWTVLGVVGSIIAIAVVASIYPSFKAAQLQPVTAMQKD